MRTTVRIDDALLEQAKRLASERGETLASVIEEALREHVMRREEVGRDRTRPRLPTFEGSGLQPGVDLDDAAALLDLMADDAAH